MNPKLIYQSAVLTALALCGGSLLLPDRNAAQSREPSDPEASKVVHLERPESNLHGTSSVVRPALTSLSGPVVRGDFVSVQVNVDAEGNNILGDAANEPSIAVDLGDPSKMAIGWRQFASIQSDFRQGGWAYTRDGGQTWTSPGVIHPTEFASDPVLDVDANGVFYYYSLQPNRGPGAWACYMYRSFDGGVTWPESSYAGGGDKAWFTIDKTGGPGHGNIYVGWNPNGSCCGGIFNRSLDGGASFGVAQALPVNAWAGTLNIGPDGALYLAGATNSGLIYVLKSPDPSTNSGAIQFSQSVQVDLGGFRASSTGPNPGGLLGQVWIATDHSFGPRHGFVYLLASVFPSSGFDPLDVMFARSTDGGLTWSDPIRVNDDLEDNGAWQWFGTMSVAPNGRIDVVWNDTRNSPSLEESELYYAQSTDGGFSWSKNEPASPPFQHFVGYPQQNKLGDYYDMVSDDTGAHLAYAATFNGEQDVYYLRIGTQDCNDNGVPDDQDIAKGTSDDCDGNGLPDECSRDCNENDETDTCEVLFGAASDCNGNVVPDDCENDYDGDEIIDGCDPDIDGDGVVNAIDLCPRTIPGFPVRGNGRSVGDANSDCLISIDDFEMFADCLFFSGPGEPVFEFICRILFDTDGDQDLDLRDVRWFQLGFGR